MFSAPRTNSFAGLIQDYAPGDALVAIYYTLGFLRFMSQPKIKQDAAGRQSTALWFEAARAMKSEM